MDDENDAARKDAKELRKDALTVLCAQMQVHERYHTQKENMTWLVTAAYVGATALVIGRSPFWEDWPIQWFGAWLVLLLTTAIGVIYLVHWQFGNRNIANVFFTCCNDVMAQCLYSGVTKEELSPVPLRELSSMLVPTALERRFREKYSGKSSWQQGLTLTVVILWTLGAGIYVMITYKALCGL